MVPHLAARGQVNNVCNSPSFRDEFRGVLLELA